MKKPTPRLIATIGIGCAVMTTGCRLFPTEKVFGNAWKSDSANRSGAAKMIYPESTYPDLMKKDSFGICFSGGGNRSAVATLGQLRALKSIGLLDRARYVSAVSGGSWGSGPWVFQQDTSPAAEKKFLGRIVEPQQLKPWDLEAVPEEGSFARSASNAQIGLARFFLRLGGDENFGKEIGKIFLRPHGLDSPKRIPVYGRKVMEEMRAMNPALTEDDFLVCKEGRPYFIAGSAMSRRDNWVGSPMDLYTPIEFTTSYTGSGGYSDHSHLLWKFDIPVGGGYVDNVIYDGWPYHQQATGANRFRVSVAKATPFPWVGASERLSLPDMLGAAGSAPTAAMPALADILGFPEFLHYSPGNLPHLRTRELLHTDGGAVENLGIMPLLARGVKNILIFDNTETPYEKDTIPGDIGYLFGRYVPGGLLGFRSKQLAEMNYVLEDSDGTKAKAMSDDFSAALDKKRTLIHCNRYKVLKQPFYGVKGGYEVNICWVVLGPAGAIIPANDSMGMRSAAMARTVTIEETKWFDAIKDPATKQVLIDHRDELKGFPHYKTFLNNGRNIIALSPLQVNTLAHFTSYSVTANAKKIEDHFGIHPSSQAQ